jgi:glycosyltransferase involved in cell wall biosynthesis
MYTDSELVRPYLLYVGGRNSHKNFNAALMSLNLKTAKEIGLELLVVGGGEFTKCELDNINKLNLLKKVKHMGQVQNSKLNQLYNEAFAFIYPSFYEGFGIPPLEAMASGCPVICSNVSSIPEVVGSAGLYFSPNEPESIESYLFKLQESAYREKTINMGLAHSAQFSWEKTGLETVKLYKEMM